jgi:hypothetical protein
MKTFAVFKIDFDHVRQERLGQVGLSDDGRLSLLSAEPAGEEALRETIDEVNGEEALTIKLRPLDDAPRHSIRKERRSRDNPGFFEALQDTLRRWHGMELVQE